MIICIISKVKCNKGNNSISNKVVCFYFTYRKKFGWKFLILIGIFQTSHTIQNWPNLEEEEEEEEEEKKIPNALPSTFPCFFLNGHTSLCISYSKSKKPHRECAAILLSLPSKDQLKRFTKFSFRYRHGNKDVNLTNHQLNAVYCPI